jgi:hypothetical protein
MPPNCDHFFPIKNFLTAGDFKSPQELAVHLIKLGLNHTAYDEYVAWRNDGIGEHFHRLLLYGQKTRPLCFLLSRIHKLWSNPYLTAWTKTNTNEDGSRVSDCINCEDHPMESISATET